MLCKAFSIRFDDWQHKCLAEGLDPVRANLVRLAIDGLGYAEMLRQQLPNEALRQQLLEMLLAMIQEAESSDLIIEKNQLFRSFFAAVIKF